MRMTIAGRWVMAAALAWIAGCGMSPTGEPWSTKTTSTSEYVPALPAVNVAAPRPTTLRDLAIDLLVRAAASETALLRANAIEAMQHAPGRMEPLVAGGLVDDNRGVRFVSAMTIGELRVERLAHLLEPLLRDESLSVRAAAIYGLYRCGYRVDQSPLASMILSDDPEVRANAAMVLGELGNRTALPVIRQAVGLGMERVGAARAKVVDLQLAEAMVKLGADEKIEVIRAALFAPAELGELTALACMMAGRLHDERVVADLVRLARRTGPNQQSAEVRMAATWALAQIAPAQATAEVPMEYVASPQDALRAQAGLTLGEVGDPSGLSALAVLLEDPNPLVQVAAAGGILQIQVAEAGQGNRASY